MNHVFLVIKCSSKFYVAIMTRLTLIYSLLLYCVLSSLRLTIVCLTKVTRRVSLVERELLTLLEHLRLTSWFWVGLVLPIFECAVYVFLHHNLSFCSFPLVHCIVYFLSILWFTDENVKWRYMCMYVIYENHFFYPFPNFRKCDKYHG